MAAMQDQQTPPFVVNVLPVHIPVQQVTREIRAHEPHVEFPFTYNRKFLPGWKIIPFRFDNPCMTVNFKKSKLRTEVTELKAEEHAPKLV